MRPLPPEVYPGRGLTAAWRDLEWRRRRFVIVVIGTSLVFAVSTALAGYGLGDPVEVSGSRFTVVGQVSGSTALAGVPNVFMLLEDVQAVGFAGMPVVSAVAVQGNPPQQPVPGFVVSDTATARADLLRPMGEAKQAIGFVSLLLWIVAAFVVGAATYLSVLERQRDFAIFKATGVPTWAIAADVAMQSVVISLVAAGLGAVVALFLAPNFPMTVAIGTGNFLTLPAIAVVIGGVASLFAMRRATGVDPALAFGAR